MKWPVVPMGKITRFLGGGTPSKARSEFWCGDIPWVSPKDMSGREIRDTEDHITETAVAESATQIVAAGSVLIVVRSGILVRRFPVAINGVAVALNQDMKALVPCAPLKSDFLAYFLEASSQNILASCVKRGATVHSIDMGKLEKIPVPIPAGSEQRRIIEILNQAREIMKKHDEADSKFASVLAALFYKMFGDPAPNSLGWRRTNFAEVIEESQYGTSVKAIGNGDGVAVIRMNNIDTAGFMDLQDLKYARIPDDQLFRLALKKGDILFNRTNSKELVGKTGLWQSEMKAVAASYLIRVRVNRDLVRPEYVWAYLNTPFMKKILFDKARSAIGMANINAEELRAFPFMVPAMDRQVAFSGRLSALDKLREGLRRSGRMLQSLETTLLYRAFSGELTAKWREVHMRELLAEMQQQARLLALPKETQLC